MVTTAHDIEIALQRVIALGERGAPCRDGVLGGTRRAMLDVLRASADSLTTEELATHVGLHVNTTRHHLDVLAAAGLVERAPSEQGARGRPKARFRATAAAAEPYDALRRELDEALRAHTEDEVAVEAARQWLDAVPPIETAPDLDAAIDAAVEALRAVGFDARTDAIGDTIVVSDCPYASLIAEHPMICTVHAELVQGALRRTGQPVTLDGLDVWVRPGVCRARLARPDTQPSFVTSPTHTSPKERP